MSSWYQQYALEIVDSNTCFLQELWEGADKVEMAAAHAKLVELVELYLFNFQGRQIVVTSPRPVTAATQACQAQSPVLYSPSKGHTSLSAICDSRHADRRYCASSAFPVCLQRGPLSESRTKCGQRGEWKNPA